MNSLEWKEVQWKNHVEDLELRHAAELAERDKVRDAKVAEAAELKRRLDVETAELRARVESLHAERAVLQQNAQAAEQSPLPGWLSMLKCPQRGGGADRSGGSGGAHHCQDMIWRVLRSVQGVPALLCTLQDW